MKEGERRVRYREPPAGGEFKRALYNAVIILAVAPAGKLITHPADFSLS